MRWRHVLLLLILAFMLSACATSRPARTAQRGPAPYSEGAPAASTEATTDAGEMARRIDASDQEKEKTGIKRPPIPSIQGQIQSGLLGMSPAAAAERPASFSKEKQKVSFHFEKVDVAEVTSQIFGDYLKLNYVLDPTLQGRISFFLDGEFTKDEMFQMITKAYEANNISVVPRTGVYYIQPIQKSSSSGLPVANTFMLKDEKSGARPMIVMYRLLYLDVKQAVNTVKFFLTPGRPITTDSLTNSLIFVEDTDNARSIVEMLKALDVNVLKEVSMEIVPLQSITPQDAVQSMEALMNKLTLFKDSAVRNNLAFIPLINYGGVLVLAQNYEVLKTAKYWLTALDVQGTEAGEQINVYFVQNGLARDIGDILAQAYGLKTSGGAGGLGQQVVSSTSRTGIGGTSFGSSSFGSRSSTGGSSSTFGRTGTSGTSSSGFGSTTGSTGSTSGTGSMFSSSGGLGSGGSSTASLSRPGTGGFSTRGGSMTTRVTQGTEIPNMLTGEVSIIPDEVNNAIVIRANAADYAKIKKTLTELDIQPRAVLIEVLIAEVALTKDLEYGLAWYFNNIGAQIGGKGGEGKLSTGHGGVNIGTLTALATTAATAGGGSILWQSTGGQDIAAVLTALATKTNVNVLSTPTLLATDNKEASIQVGGREPIPSQTLISSTTNNDVVSSIEYAETGIILNVIPHINAGGLVRLEVEQTIRRADEQVNVGGTTAPKFTERNIKTTLLAQNESTVVIGGIIQQSETRSKEGIPFLGDIPIVAPLFATQSKRGNRTELIIAITPHVVEHKETEATREFVDKLRQLKKRIDG